MGGQELTGIQNGGYWSGTPLDPGNAYLFVFDGGFQAVNSVVLNVNYAWAVRPGDVGVAAVPEPATLSLLGVALAAFGLSRRRNKA